MTKPIIEVENLGKRYRLGRIGAGSLRNEIENGLMRLRGQLVQEDERDFWALKDVSFTVNEGEVLGIIGRNGAGKSTLLKLLSRITEPTTGRAILRGRVASLLEVGTGFHPELSGRENIYLNGAIMGMNRAEVARKFDEIVEFSGTEKFIDTPVKRYSSGMRVRLGFAVAAHLEPEILIVDEVLAVGDAEFQKRCLGKMSEVASAGRTILFVSHQMPMVQKLCTRGILLDRGVIEVQGQVDDVVRDYFRNDSSVSSECDVDLRGFPREISQYEGLTRAKLIGSENGTLSMGSRFEVRVEFSFTRVIDDIGFGMGVEDVNGVRIFSLNSYMLNSSTPKCGQTGIVTFLVPDSPLVPGDYWVTISVAERQKQLIDRCDRCMRISVYPEDLFNSGIIVKRDKGVVFVRGLIDIKSNS